MNSRMAAVDERGWMYSENRVCNEYLKGVDIFIEAAVEDMKRTKKKVTAPARTAKIRRSFLITGICTVT